MKEYNKHICTNKLLLPLCIIILWLGLRGPHKQIKITYKWYGWSYRKVRSLKTFLKNGVILLFNFQLSPPDEKILCNIYFFLI